MPLSFIVIDENEFDCFIAGKIINFKDKRADVKAFRNAQLALDFLRITPEKTDKNPTVIFLDLQMPIMNGYQFVNEFENLPSEIQNGYRIIVLSATRNVSDISRILNYPSVQSILEKPLTKEKINEVFNQLAFLKPVK
ncbi:MULTISPECIES: response regulator [unclassified Mucilaginibacter]|uniref:response regulator n=1 Tax=unclassified Mucilaginibacter TaxID=2617802 RepID=UPI002AC8F51E|nr:MULTISPECIES: response regulator [unclassified Mucilaginibacter]MEB0261219.1 response regulator [Mucilaginibacter sp. 10I4]MEB0280392.1 response regulator [Mucilaginibacter sp. 10B2]MEB0300413.1 response regulator [Mucilaginibacter sp. 5C4]WPX24518.1 response regulator [Mucilaginibacter sp. 5C4]